MSAELMFVLYLSFRFLKIFFRKFKIRHDCSLWRNQKPQLSGKLPIVEQNEISFPPLFFFQNGYRHRHYCRELGHHLVPITPTGTLVAPAQWITVVENRIIPAESAAFWKTSLPKHRKRSERHRTPQDQRYPLTILLVPRSPKFHSF